MSEQKTPFEDWWHYQGSAGPNEGEDREEFTKRVCKWAWLMGEADATTGDKATGTEARVCEDIASRQKLGLKKYGTTVESNPLNLREWVNHAYEEALDMAIYLRRAIEEIEGVSK